MTPEEIKQKIDQLDHYMMAEVYRFTPAGTVPFDREDTTLHFMLKWNALGGMTPTISKGIGFDSPPPKFFGDTAP